jgi:hypothetical protein
MGRHSLVFLKTLDPEKNFLKKVKKQAFKISKRKNFYNAVTLFKNF